MLLSIIYHKCIIILSGSNLNCFNSTKLVMTHSQQNNVDQLKDENDPLIFNKLESYGIVGHSQSKNGTPPRCNNLSLQRLNTASDKSRRLSLSMSPVASKTLSETSTSIDDKKKEYNYKMLQYLDNYFQITIRGSTIMTEIRGGTVGFLTLAYIVLLNPQVLNVSGIPYQYAASSTCLSSCIASDSHVSTKTPTISRLSTCSIMVIKHQTLQPHKLIISIITIDIMILHSS